MKTAAYFNSRAFALLKNMDTMATNHVYLFNTIKPVIWPTKRLYPYSPPNGYVGRLTLLRTVAYP